MSDWLAFLAARLDEDEAKARGLYGATRFMGGEPDFYGQGGPAASAFWRHFTSHRMIRDTKAKRAILAEHHPGYPTTYPKPSGQPTCSVCDQGSWDTDPVPWPCPTVRHLAAVYSDHPDYPLRSGPSPDPGDEQGVEQQGEQAREHDKGPSSRGDAASAAGEV